MTYEEIVESRIQEAMSSGVFRNLPGEGAPLQFRYSEQLAGEQWLGYKILSDADMLPEWLLLAREIEELDAALKRIDQRHESLARVARESGRWERFMPGLSQLREEFEREARKLRRKQDRFNHDAPSIRLERPGIWVEYHLERIDARISSPLPEAGELHP